MAIMTASSTTLIVSRSLELRSNCEIVEHFLAPKASYIVDSRYLEIEGTVKNSSRYPYFNISDL